MARICAWKVPVDVEIGDFGKFRLVVKRLPVDERGALLELVDRVNKLRTGLAEAAEAAPAEEAPAGLAEAAESMVEVADEIRKQVESLVLEVSGIEFEWADGETSEPKDIGALIDDLARLEPLAVADRVFQIWQVCIEEQVLSPFVHRRSGSTPGSKSGAPDSGPGKSGTTTPTADPAPPRGCAESAGAPTSTTGP